MDFSLRWLLTLAELENVTEAAAELGMSQPALSRRLLALEHHLGSPLFDRPGRRMLLNEAGRIYADAAQRAEYSLGVAAARITELRQHAPPTLRLGFLHSFGPWLVPEIIRQAAQDHPGLQHHLVQDAAETIGHLVAAGDLDIALVSPRPTVGGPLAWKPLISERIGLGVPHGHRLASAETVSLEDAAEETFITMPPHYGMRKVLDDACVAAGFTPHIGTECQELGTVAGLVSAGLGVALLPLTEHAPPPPTMRIIPLNRPALRREIGFIWARGRALPAVARHVRDHSVPQAQAPQLGAVTAGAGG